MNYRTVEISVNAEGALDLPNTLYGGVQGEHLATRLSFTIDDAWSGSAFYLVLHTMSNKAIRSETWTDLSFYYDIESLLMIPSSLTIHLFAITTVSDVTQVFQLGRFALEIDNAIEAENLSRDHSYDQMAGYESRLAQLTTRIDAIETLLDI